LGGGLTEAEQVRRPSAATSAAADQDQDQAWPGPAPADEPAAPEAAAPEAAESAQIEELKQLAALKDQGILTEEEFRAGVHSGPTGRL
jgi:class 3 adenylate cyclase